MNRDAFDRRKIPDVAVEGIWVTGDGHAIRRIDWPVPADDMRGSILFLGGRADGYEKYLETLHGWYQAGWRVSCVDWRGQAGSGRMAGDAVTGHIEDFSVWVDDLAGFWGAWTAQVPGPHVIIGHSMGGHLVLRAIADRQIDPAAAVLCAPMLGFIADRFPIGIMHGVARLMRRIRGETAQAWKWNENPGEIPVGRINLLTHDKERYADELFWRKERPELVMGPGSWGWVERSYASMRTLFAPGNLEAVATPILLIGTSHDRLVSWDAIKQAADRLPHAELVAFGREAHHEILRETDAVRDRALKAIGTFLDRVIKSSDPT